jgi:hypothetical protein
VKLDPVRLAFYPPGDNCRGIMKRRHFGTEAKYGSAQLIVEKSDSEPKFL